jgi:glycosyltransferase involved in cell wall biosynthesis
MPTVCMNPYPTDADNGDGGIRRVVDAMIRYLPEFGWHVTNIPNGADLIANHGAMLLEMPGIPMVSHNHGLYWREYQWPGWGDRINGAVTDAMLRANAVTAPSKWVANAIRRGSLINPTVIYHGIDLDEWQPAESLGYVLWNKARVDPVSDPVAVSELARRLPNVPFVTTHGGEGLPNVQRIGTTTYAQMKEVVRHAGVYLATVRETFGIGTLEAMAAGVPVVGWDFAGQSEIFTGSEGGILVPIGDYDALASAIRQVLEHRRHYGMSGRMEVRERWQWRDKVAQYAQLYDQVLRDYHAPKPKVSVVITCYNLGRYLNAAMESVVHQRGGVTDAGIEMIVVDDCSTDDSYATAMAMMGYLSGHGVKGIQVRQTKKNSGLSAARNLGASHANGQYILFLDADDMLEESALERLSSALDRDTSLHVAGGGLDLIDERGSNRRRNPWPGTVDFRGQAAHINQLHYAAMWRREAFVRSGGFRTRDWRAEDASHWLRVMGQGLRVAQVTEDATLLYRVRSDSKSQEEARSYADRDGDWTYWLPWRAGVSSGQEGTALIRDGGIRLDPKRVPFSAMQPPVGKHAWPVAHHADPLVSIIIPVGTGHVPYLTDALDSVLAQTFDNWECIVVDDSGTPAHGDGVTIELPGHPWATIVHGGNIWDSDRPRMGAGLARNIGVERSKAPLVLFLDADDMLLPDALERLLRVYAQGDTSFVYGDSLIWKERWDSAHEVIPSPAFDQDEWLGRVKSPDKLNMPAVTCLIERRAVVAVPFNEDLAGWEDGLWYLELAANGYCGTRMPYPTLLYRLATGQRRNVSHKQAKSLRKVIDSKILPYLEGTMIKKSCCGGNVPTISLTAEQMALVAPDVEALAESIAPAPDGKVRVKYVGPLTGTFPITGRPSGTGYMFGNNPYNRYQNVDPRDVGHLLGHEGFEVVGR